MAHLDSYAGAALSTQGEGLYRTYGHARVAASRKKPMLALAHGPFVVMRRQWIRRELPSKPDLRIGFPDRIILGENQPRNGRGKSKLRSKAVARRDSHYSLPS